MPCNLLSNTKDFDFRPIQSSLYTGRLLKIIHFILKKPLSHYSLHFTAILPTTANSQASSHKPKTCLYLLINYFLQVLLSNSGLYRDLIKTYTVLQSLLSFIPILRQFCNTMFSANSSLKWVEIDTSNGGKHFLLKKLRSS